ncbi:MAG: flagellar basal body rod protein FlgC [Chitinispirillales bacterium]|jgi:flagellar basal-body rod protein FlgC|nr:flagellar basal body rod protein FlgC [Chitinispirillales bacterium]
MSDINGLFSAMRISASGMRAQRIKHGVITSNLANAETTRTPEGGPYKREFVVFEADGRDSMIGMREEKGLSTTATHQNHAVIPARRYSLYDLEAGQGVRVAEIRKDSKEARMQYDPSHPDANEEGYVALPNINIIEEMTDMINASRAYEANVTAFNATKQMMMSVFQ